MPEPKIQLPMKMGILDKKYTILGGASGHAVVKTDCQMNIKQPSMYRTPIQYVHVLLKVNDETVGYQYSKEEGLFARCVFSMFSPCAPLLSPFRHFKYPSRQLQYSLW